MRRIVVKRWQKLLLALAGAAVVVIAVIIMVFTQTSYGRARARVFVMKQLASSVHGILNLGPVHGNLLTGARIDGLTITDSAGHPFLRADTVFIRYSLYSFLLKRVFLRDVRLIHPVVVADQQPGARWNFDLLFAGDSTLPPAAPGFGSWIRIDHLTVVGGDVTVRRAWAPPIALTGASRDAAIARALSATDGDFVVRVPGGYQALSSFTNVDAFFPRVLWADPGRTAHVVDIGTLSTFARPYKPEPADVRNVSGHVTIGVDTIGFRNLRVTLPGSLLTFNGNYSLSTADVSTVIHADTVEFEDLHFVYPTLPAGHGRLDLAVATVGLRKRLVATNMDLHTQGARVQGAIDLQVGVATQINSSDLAFAGLDTRIIHTFAPALHLPIDGVLDGHAGLAGTASELTVDGWTRLVDRRGEASRITADGKISNRPGGVFAHDLRLHFDPVRASLLRTLGANVPLGGAITGRAVLNGPLADRFTVDADVIHADPATGSSHITGIGGLSVGRDAAARDLRLTFDPLQMALVRSLAPDVLVDGTLSGRATISGVFATSLFVDADVVHTDPQLRRSHVFAAGDVLTAGVVSARDLALRFEPLQVAVLRSYWPTWPFDGVVTGRATVNGTPKNHIAAVVDITHEGSTGTSRFTGDAAATFADVLQRVDLNLRAHPLALATAGLFMPAAGLQATAAGTIVAHGTRDDIPFTADLTVPGSGSVLTRGSLVLGDLARYDLRTMLQGFDPSVVSAGAPAAQLNGTIDAKGRGTTLATAVTSFDIALSDSRLAATPRTDSTRVIAHLDSGLVTVTRGHVRLASALADVDGTFGLIDAKTGTLHYRIAVDTLSRVALFATGDTTSVSPRPAQQARLFAEARADSTRIAKATEVERAATGLPLEPKLKVDSLVPIPRDSVAGVIHTEGTLTGNIACFGADGAATMRDVLFLGNQIRSGSVAYKLTNAPGAQMGAALTAHLTAVRAAGFGFDSLYVVLNHTGGRSEASGDVDVAIFQAPGADYRIKTGFVLAPDRKELRLTDLSLRLDSTLWHATQPGAVSWGASGIGLHTIDLRNTRGGHVFADGTLPSAGSGDVQIAIDSLQIGDITALLQDTLVTRGLLSLHTRVHGTAAAPLFSGTVGLDSAMRGGMRMPDLRSTFEYAHTQLTAKLQLIIGTHELLNAQLTAPVDLAVSGRQGSRLLDGPVTVDARMDSLPLDALPSFTSAVQNVRGLLQGDVAMRGTFTDPVLTGVVRLSLGSMRVIEPGIALTNGTATLTFKDRTIIVDSLVARSGGGLVRVAGTLDVTHFTRPGFDFHLTAANALALNNRWGKLNANAAIEIKGPFEGVHVTGAVALQSGTINAPEQARTQRAANLEDPTLSSVLDSLAVPMKYRRVSSPIFRNLQMDVGVTIARGTWVRNSSANVEIYTPGDVDPLHVRVNNAKQAITLEGTVNADRGEYTLAGRTFKLTTGSVTFLGTDDLDPMLQLSAQYEVPRRSSEALTILINVGGYLYEPRITLSSNAQPPLAQSDLISYLAFGRTSTSLLSPEGSGIGGGDLGIIAQQQLAGLGLGAFTDGLIRGFEKQGAHAGLDVFRIHPGTLPDELSFGGYFQNMLRSTQVEAGEYITPRLFAALEGHTNLTVPGLRLEYETRHGFSWRATWEPRYLPIKPSLVDLSAATLAQQTRVLGLFLFWVRRF
jgi:translocation and assembly module TamB